VLRAKPYEEMDGNAPKQNHMTEMDGSASKQNLIKELPDKA
jgi:hypothetical protein